MNRALAYINFYTLHGWAWAGFKTCIWLGAWTAADLFRKCLPLPMQLEALESMTGEPYL